MFVCFCCAKSSLLSGLVSSCGKCFFVFCCAKSSLLSRLVSSCGKWGLLSSCGVRASHCGGLSSCGAFILGHSGFSSCGKWAQQLHLRGAGAQAQQWRVGLAALLYAGSSWTRDGTCASCFGRWILDH